MKKGQSPKKCARCNRRSLTGLKTGVALCQAHFDEAMWGKAWADQCNKRGLYDLAEIFDPAAKAAGSGSK